VTAAASTAGTTIKNGAVTTLAVTKVGVNKLNSAIDANPTLASAKNQTYQGFMAANTYAKKGLGSVGSYFGWGKKKEPVEVEAPIEYVEEPQADGDTEAKVDLIE